MQIEIKDVSFNYALERAALDGINFSSCDGRTVAIVGASGSGKSTFLRLLSGILPGNNEEKLTGHIAIDGYSPKEYTKQGNVGFMFQEPSLMPNLTVRENIAFPLKLKKKKLNGEIDELLETVSLKEFEHYLPSQLSGGMKTRVALARTFSTTPKLLLLDEPFSALDIRWRYRLYQELTTLQNRYQSKVVIVTHDIQEALLLSDHILVFGQNGKMVSELEFTNIPPRNTYADVVSDMQEQYTELQDLIMSN